MFVTMVIAALIVDGIFSGLDLIPSTARHQRRPSRRATGVRQAELRAAGSSWGSHAIEPSLERRFRDHLDMQVEDLRVLMRPPTARARGLQLHARGDGSSTTCT
jgi:hypothetical protein